MNEEKNMNAIEGLIELDLLKHAYIVNKEQASEHLYTTYRLSKEHSMEKRFFEMCKIVGISTNILKARVRKEKIDNFLKG
jgi:hypothetical protein